MYIPICRHAHAPRGFAILYSVGNLIALIGTFFLAGPMRLQRSAECRTQVPEFSLRDGKCRQLRRMGREHRWVVSLCFLVSMVLTLVVARLSLFWLGEAWGEAPELFGECNSGSHAPGELARPHIDPASTHAHSMGRVGPAPSETARLQSSNCEAPGSTEVWYTCPGCNMQGLQNGWNTGEPWKLRETWAKA